MYMEAHPPSLSGRSQVSHRAIRFCIVMSRRLVPGLPPFLVLSYARQTRSHTLCLTLCHTQQRVGWPQFVRTVRMSYECFCILQFFPCFFLLTLMVVHTHMSILWPGGAAGFWGLVGLCREFSQNRGAPIVGEGNRRAASASARPQPAEAFKDVSVHQFRFQAAAYHEGWQYAGVGLDW